MRSSAIRARNQLVLGYDRARAQRARRDIRRCRVPGRARARRSGTRRGALYGGPFLDGVYLDDAPEFEHWLDGVRLRLGRAAERAMEQLAIGRRGSRTITPRPRTGGAASRRSIR